MANISYRAASVMTNRFGWNGGNEYEDEGELNYSNTFYRKYDAQIGRFTGVDIKAEEQVDLNPYQFGNNNPVMFNDPKGDRLKGLSQKGPDGNYYAPWWSEFMWRNAGFLDWGADNGGGGGGDGGGLSSLRNLQGMSAQQIVDNMRPGFSYGKNKKGEYGFWGYLQPAYNKILNNGVVEAYASHWTVLSGFGGGPGTFYSSIDAAAVGWYSTYRSALMQQQVEWSSVIYSLKAKSGNIFYSYTSAITNHKMRNSPGPTDKRHIIPAGAIIVGSAHSHLKVGGLLKSNEYFSSEPGADNDQMTTNSFDYYLLTMNGNLRVTRDSENVGDLLLMEMNSKGILDVTGHMGNFTINGMSLQNTNQLLPVKFR